MLSGGTDYAVLHPATGKGCHPRPVEGRLLKPSDGFLLSQMTRRFGVMQLGQNRFEHRSNCYHSIYGWILLFGGFPAQVENSVARQDELVVALYLRLPEGAA